MPAIEELKALPTAQLSDAIHELWLTLAEREENLPVPEWQRRELNRRRQREADGLSSGRTMEQVEAACRAGV